jgi:hypothetical protein
MGYQCHCCGAWHDERRTAFGLRMPAVVASLTDDERATRATLGSDQCVLDDEHFFILGNLELPVRDSTEVITWTVWSTLSEMNFERSSDLWHTEGRESEPPYFGWLSNSVPGYPDSLNIKVLVHTQPVGSRPKLEVIDESHRLYRDQREGIAAAWADELIHAALFGAPPENARRVTS